MSKHMPGSVHAPCVFQLVFTMQNAEPQDAAASPATARAIAPASSMPAAARGPIRDDPDFMFLPCSIPATRGRTHHAMRSRADALVAAIAAAVPVKQSGERRRSARERAGNDRLLRKTLGWPAG